MAKLLSGTRIYGTATIDTQVLVNGSISASSTNSGSLQVIGGAGIGGSLYVGGTVTATTFVGAFSGTTTKATNLAGGNAWQIPYQSAPDTTAFANSGTTGQFWQATTNGAPTWTSTANIYVANAGIATNVRAGTAGQLHYQSGADTTSFINTATTGNFLQANYVGAPTWTTTANIYVGNSAKVDVAAQTNSATYYPTFVDANNASATAESFYTTSSFVINPATAQVGLGYISTSSRLTVNGRIESMTDPASEGGQIVLRGKTWYRWSIDNYQDTLRIIREDDVTEANGTTALSISSGTNSAVMLGTTTPYSGERLAVNGGVYVNGILTATTIYGTFAGTIGGSVTINTATNLANGTAGQIPYQTAPSTTSFINTATTGNFLQANYVGAPTWTTTANIYVANASISTNVRAGTAGQLHYQSAVDTTGFINTATTGNFLQANYVGAPTWTTTANIYVQDATVSTNLRGGTAGQLPYQSSTGTTSFTGPGTFGQFLMSTGASAPVYQSTLTQLGGNIIVTSNTSATSTTTGALQIVNGGAGIGSNIVVGGYGRFNGAFDEAASTTTVALYVGVAGSAPASPRVAFSNSGTTWQIDNYNGNFRWYIPGTTRMQIDTNGNLSVYSTTSTYSTTTGALIVSGGIGVAGGGYFGGIVTATTYYGTFAGTIGGTTTINTASNIAGGTAGQLHYQSAPGVTAFVGTATTGYFLQANYVGAPTWTSSSTIQVGYAANVLGAGTGNILYQSGNNTTSLLSTGTAGQILMAAGGAPVWTNTSSIYVTAATQVNTVAQTTNASYYPTFVDSNNATAGAESVYTTSSFSINPSTGDTTHSGKLAVNNSAYNTATNTANAIYTSGGIYADGGLTVGANGPVLFKGPVTFSGTSTYVFSTQTVYTDNILNLHTPPGGVNSQWTLDDGKDIGLRFHYFTNSTDTNAALVLANDTKYLEWYSSGAESTGSTFTSATYGTFKTGAIKLAGGAANSSNTTSGDLQVLGGVGIGGSVYVGGSITVAGTINASITGVSTTATNIAGGTAGQLVYQTAPGATSFAGPGTFGQLLMSTGASAPVYQSTLTQAGGNIIVTSNTAATSTSSGALQIVNGGLGVGGAGYFGGAIYSAGVKVVTTTTSDTVYITNTTAASSTLTGALRVSGGVGIGGSLYAGNIYTNGTQTIPLNIQEFTATGGQTSFTVSGGYTVGTVQIFANGIALGSGDFTASNGTTVVTSIARNVGDIIRIISGGSSTSVNNIQNFSVAMSIAMGM